MLHLFESLHHLIMESFECEFVVTFRKNLFRQKVSVISTLCNSMFLLLIIHDISSFASCIATKLLHLLYAALSQRTSCRFYDKETKLYSFFWLG
jgi:hypothetical protein